MKNNWENVRFACALSQEELRAMDACAWLARYRTGEPVVWEGDICTALYFVQSGAIEIYRTAMDGREHALGIIYPGDGFNLVPVLGRIEENPASARCVQDSRLLVISKENMQKLFKRYPNLITQLAAEMAGRLQKMTQQAGALALQTVRQRLAAFLIKMADNADDNGEIFWTRDAMARQIGTVRDVIGRHLKRMEEEGILRRDRGDLDLLDRERLNNIASGVDAT